MAYKNCIQMSKRSFPAQFTFFFLREMNFKSVSVMNSLTCSLKLQSTCWMVPFGFLLAWYWEWAQRERCLLKLLSHSVQLNVASSSLHSFTVVPPLVIQLFLLLLVVSLIVRCRSRDRLYRLLDGSSVSGSVADRPRRLLIFCNKSSLNITANRLRAYQAFRFLDKYYDFGCL